MQRPSSIHGGDIWTTGRNLGCPPADLFDFSSNINPLGPSPLAVAAAQEAMKEVSAYPDPTCRALVEGLSAYHGISPESLLIGNGATELIYLLARRFGGRALIAIPSFSDYERSVRVAGGEVRFHPRRPREPFAIDPFRLARALRSGDRLIFVGNPNNPTGQRLDPEALRHLLARASRLGVQMVVDESFIDLCEEGSLLREAPVRRGLIVVRGFTKFFALAGIRVGYLAAHPRTIGALRRTKEPWTVNTPAQAMARASLLDRPYIEKSRREMVHARSELIEGLSGMDGLTIYPTEASFVLMRLPGRWTARALAERLLPKRILIREAASFHGLGAQHVRLAVKGREANRLLIASLKEILSGAPGSPD